MDRRRFILGAAALPLATPALAQQTASLRGTLDASRFGVEPGRRDDQSRNFQRLLDRASKENRPVFLPPGRYAVANIDLPRRMRIMGLGRTATLVHAGGDRMLSGLGCETVRLEGLVIDGANGRLADDFAGLVHLRGCADILVRDCAILGSGAIDVSLERCGGTVEDCTISGAAGLAGLYSVEATGLAIRDNTVERCANGGILVHRWNAGADDTVVTGNRVRAIGAARGGTGQYGNGVNVFRAHGVQVANNHIADCAFSAVRCNSASNALIAGNTCLRSGETGIYAEFAFQGSVIADNIVDGATIGISIANFDEGGRLVSCTGNLVRNLKTDGPYPAEVAGFGHGIYAEADTVVANNVVEGAPRWGLAFGWGPYLRNVVATGNMVRDCGTGCAVSVAEGAGACAITNNIFAGSRRGAIVPHRWLEPVSRPPERFGHLTVRGNVTA